MKSAVTASIADVEPLHRLALLRGVRRVVGVDHRRHARVHGLAAVV
jgi:hypothetical protein